MYYIFLMQFYLLWKKSSVSLKVGVWDSGLCFSVLVEKHMLKQLITPRNIIT